MQTKDITCNNGSGEYTTQFSSGINVEVGPVRKGEFADRACAARLVAKGEEVSVVDDAGQVGIDVLGADLGLGRPVVAFQIDRTGSGTNVVYQIYSLKKPAQMIYKLSGGDYYSAADTDMDGRVEIWTDDASVMDGFEGVPGADFDFAPTIVLRFENGHPVDVGSEFTAQYDGIIAKLRSQLNKDDLAEFKRSDGKPSLKTLQSGEELHRLMRTKISIMEVIWEYLYSGRDKQAWAALEELWPSRDSDRIRSAISDLHSRGVLHNVGRSQHVHSRRSHARIYDEVLDTPVLNTVNPYGGAPPSSAPEPPVVQPKSILLRRPPSSVNGGFPSENETLELVVDAAGKVRSAKVINATDDLLIQASSGWHFIPAYREGLPVACRFRLAVSTLK
ncbi:MAG: hypothetical protein JST28_14215 [Acidobacteria bacterium]|nr:hypothetical protein [Acidobacteriota bacterium]